ncbi:unnamed protein product [Gongylonema pulchrum]|uniref:Actin maturation protease n=1 Tax=Gongylonema pulchrum TaxID=637853 RepID=A0A183DFT4_9BILA|nr:unnamed protein product [Gongylonema pulchrum]
MHLQKKGVTTNQTKAIFRSQVGFLCPVEEMKALWWSTSTMTHCCSSILATHVFCLHGKSHHLAVWNYEKLAASNRNLHQAVMARECNYVMPAGGDLSTLRNRCLFIRCP